MAHFILTTIRSGKCNDAGLAMVETYDDARTAAMMACSAYQEDTKVFDREDGDANAWLADRNAKAYSFYDFVKSGRASLTIPTVAGRYVRLECVNAATA